RVPRARSSVRSERRPVTPEAAGSSPVGPVQRQLQWELALLVYRREESRVAQRTSRRMPPPPSPLYRQAAGEQRPTTRSRAARRPYVPAVPKGGRVAELMSP